MGKTSTRHYRPRGSKGKLISSKEKTEGAAKVISSLVNASVSDDTDTLIDIKITNPLKRIYELIQELKKKQATTFSLKLTVPLIALPIFLFAAFQLGRDRAMCEQYFTSKIGTIKKLTIEVPQKKQGIFSFLRRSRIDPTTTEYEREQRAILIDSDGNTITILHHKGVKLERYENATVVISGTYSSCTDIITLVSDKNIVLLSPL